MNRFAANCSLLRRFAAFCGVLRRIAANCCVLRRFAVNCSVLRRIAANCGELRKYYHGVSVNLWKFFGIGKIARFHLTNLFNSLTAKCVPAGTKNSSSEDFLLAKHTSHKHPYHDEPFSSQAACF